jgi:hypothetical protein
LSLFWLLFVFFLVFKNFVQNFFFVFCMVILVS